MFKQIKRLFEISRLKTINNNSSSTSQNNQNNQNNKDSNDETGQISKSLSKIKLTLEERFSLCNDFILREISSENSKAKVIVTYIDGLADTTLVNSNIIKPLLKFIKSCDKNYGLKSKAFVQGFKELISTADIKEIYDFEASILSILSGETIIYIENCDIALKCSLKNWDKRNVEEPATDIVVRGPREGFTETLYTNISMLRRKIKNTNLKFEILHVGEQTRTEVCICYIKGIVNDEILNTLRQKIQSIRIDAILESGYIEEYIQEANFSIFPTVGNSEKPDIIAAKILEGRVAVLCDGTPFVLTVPYLFVEALQASEDYYTRFIYSFIIRLVRVLAFFMTTMLPAYYVALVNFHQDIIPYKLLLTMTASRDGIPFSAFVEALVMVFTFELLREAGIRMPRAIGQAISIVGALIIGDAAVSAGLVSTPMVIVIAVTAVSSFILPQLTNAMLIIRLVTLVAANIIGILGIVLISIVFFIDLCCLRSFGVNYLSPFTPISGMDLKDTFIRFPLWSMFTRPKVLTWEHGGRAKYRAKHQKEGK